MKGYTIQHSIDLLEKAVENGGGSGGSTTAADVSYNNTSSHLTADDVQEAIDELNTAIGSITVTAADVSYDNTSSHLTADDVQEAIDELNTKITEPTNYYPTDTNEHQIGDNLYVRRFTGASLSALLNVLIEGATGTLVDAYGYVSSSSDRVQLGMYYGNTDFAFVYQEKTSGNIGVQTGTGLRDAYDIYVVYTKGVTPNTRKKK